MHCMAIGEFVENNDLVLCYNTNLSTVDYTVESKINGSTSCVDHVYYFAYYVGYPDVV